MKCPLCRADGEPLFVGYACTRPGCKNFVPSPKPPLRLPHWYAAGYRYEYAGAKIGSRTWAKHQHALGRQLAYRTVYNGSDSGWHTPDPAGVDVDPSWEGFDAADPTCPNKEPALEVEWRLA